MINFWKIYKKYVELDKDKNGMLSKEELIKYGPGLTPIFIDRIFEEYQRYEEYLIQSALIRIMKSRIGQVTTHNWLVSESIKQIDRLKAQPQQIKENIEKLIEKNCIKRDEKNKRCYEYVA